VSGRGGTWSKDGAIVFTPSSSQNLFSVSAAGGTPEPASKLDVAQGENSHRWPWFLPDGKHFLYWSRTSRPGESPVLYVGELGSLQAKLLTKSETMAQYASGRLLFLRGQTLMAQPFNPGRMELSGEPEPVAEHIAVNGASIRAMFSASETGTLVYQSGEASTGWDLVWRGRDGKQTDAIAQPSRYIGPSLSPDGTRFAVTIFVGNQGIADIWVFDLGPRNPYPPDLQQRRHYECQPGRGDLDARQQDHLLQLCLERGVPNLRQGRRRWQLRAPRPGKR
jgi:hypothetical protein